VKVSDTYTTMSNNRRLPLKKQPADSVKTIEVIPMVVEKQEDPPSLDIVEKFLSTLDFAEPVEMDEIEETAVVDKAVEVVVPTVNPRGIRQQKYWGHDQRSDEKGPINPVKVKDNKQWSHDMFDKQDEGNEVKTAKNTVAHPY